MTPKQNRHRLNRLRAEGKGMPSADPSPAVGVSTGFKRRHPGATGLVTQGVRVA